MAVTLHQPAEGQDAGTKYSGPREDWLVENGYASRSGGQDGLHATSVDAKDDPTLARNRELPAEPGDEKQNHPQPKGDVRDVADDPSRYKAPEGDPIYTEGSIDARMVLGRSIMAGEQRSGLDEKAQKRVDEGRSPEVAPDVDLGATFAAIEHDRATAAEGDPDVLKRQEKAEKAFEKDAEKVVKSQEKAAKKKD